MPPDAFWVSLGIGLAVSLSILSWGVADWLVNRNRPRR